MANLDLTGQDVEYSTIAPKLLRLKQCLDERKVIWHRITIAKRKAWVVSGKDPIMSVAWDIYKYLDRNFFGRKFYDDDA